MVSEHLKSNMGIVCFLHFSRPLLITFLITLSLEIFKELLFLKKVWKIKVLKLGSKKYTNLGWSPQSIFSAYINVSFCN